MVNFQLMKLIKKSRLFIGISILLWVIGHIVYFTNISFWLSNLLLWISPCLLLFGVILYIVRFRLKNGRFPNPTQFYFEERIKKSRGPFAGTQVIFDNFYEFIVAWFAIWMAIAIVARDDVSHRSYYQQILPKLNEQQYLKRFGKVNAVGFYIGVEVPPDTPENTIVCTIKVNTDKSVRCLDACFKKDIAGNFVIDTIIQRNLSMY